MYIFEVFNSLVFLNIRYYYPIISGIFLLSSSFQPIYLTNSGKESIAGYYMILFVVMIITLMGTYLVKGSMAMVFVFQ